MKFAIVGCRHIAQRHLVMVQHKSIAELSISCKIRIEDDGGFIGIQAIDNIYTNN